MCRFRTFLLLAVGPPLLAVAGLAATVPEGFTSEILASQIESPVALTVLADGRILVAQQRGRILSISPDGDSAPIWTVPGVSAEGERGLLGLAPHPQFEANGWLYFYYTANGPRVHNRLSRIRLDGDAVTGAEEVLVDFPPVGSAIRHFGGALAFAADGTLFLAVGDHAGRHNAQNLSVPFGKIHRFLDDGSVPSGNPFPGSSVWVYGLRNPFTFAIQTETGRFFANDVGSKDWEEINEIEAGGDYGWPDSEGPEVSGADVAPIHAYAHTGGACAITGGVFYPRAGGVYPAQYRGLYFFSDFCGGWIRTLDPDSGQITTFATELAAPTNLGLDREGRLLYLSRDGTDSDAGIRGRVVRVEVAGAPPAPELPRILEHPSDVTVAAGAAVRFEAVAENAETLEWQRDRLPIAAETTTALTIPAVQLADSGARFRLVARNDYGEAVSDEALLTVLGGSNPVPEITTPAPGALFPTGETVEFSGRATDAEDGELDAEQLSWEVVLRHDEHFHPFLLPVEGVDSGSFVMPEISHGPGISWLELRLVAEDSDGNRAVSRRAIVPESLVDGTRSDLLSLREGRFVATVTYVDPRSGTREGSFAEPITREFGAFWFFKRSNLELFLKILDGTDVNGAHWVFFGGLSNLELTVTVLDTWTGQAWTRSSEPGELLADGDVDAFPGEAHGDPSSFGKSSSGSHVEPRATTVHLGLLRGRFQLTLDWRDPRTGALGPGVPVALTDESGLYWFFGRTNFEVAVKMLDGTEVNGHYWLFLTALTDLELTLRVRDTVTGREREYVKPAYRFGAFTDTEAMPPP